MHLGNRLMQAVRIDGKFLKIFITWDGYKMG